MDNFDSLKREATKLERNLEDKVSRYQQLVQSIPDPTTSDLFLAESGMVGGGGGRSSGVSSSSAAMVDDEATLRHDIQRTLATLEDLVSARLQPAAERSGSSSSILLVKRYREILFDLKGDYEKTRQSHTRKMDRIKLMEGTNKKNSSLEIGGGAGGGDSTGIDHLMREGRHIQNSSNAAAAVINQAAEIRNDLRQQGLTLGRVQTTMGKIVGNIPGINTLIDKIKRKKSKDDMIVAGVIASCILFTLWYVFG